MSAYERNLTHRQCAIPLDDFIVDEIGENRLGETGKVLGWAGGSGKTLKKLGHEIACPSENELYVTELLDRRAQKLLLH
jgi:hypothetical protein